MELTTAWFLLIAVLWTGYFFLEGFDFGVGVLLPVLGRSDTQRRVLINTIGPVWDGNEVWLLTAVGATFAAFPEWYASLLSAFYTPVLMIVLALIVRAVAFEYRGKGDTAAWRRGWDRCIVVCSLVPAAGWGLVFANVLRGVPLDAQHDFAGAPADLISPYALLGGLTTLALFVLHGAVFLALKTKGDVHDGARRLVLRGGLVTSPVLATFLLWTQLAHGHAATWWLLAAAVLTVPAAVQASRARRDGWAFVLTGVAIVATTVMLFWALFPDLLPSTVGHGLTVTAGAATGYTLRIMTVVAVVFAPLVLLYQGWTYWVFRQRIGTEHIPAAAPRPAHGR